MVSMIEKSITFSDCDREEGWKASGGGYETKVSEKEPDFFLLVPSGRRDKRRFTRYLPWGLGISVGAVAVVLGASSIPVHVALSLSLFTTVLAALLWVHIPIHEPEIEIVQVLEIAKDRLRSGVRDGKPMRFDVAASDVQQLQVVELEGGTYVIVTLRTGTRAEQTWGRSCCFEVAEVYGPGRPVAGDVVVSAHNAGFVVVHKCAVDVKPILGEKGK